MANPGPSPSPSRRRFTPRVPVDGAAAAYGLVAGVLSFGAGSLVGLLLGDLVDRIAQLAVMVGVTFALVIVAAWYADAIVARMRASRR